MKNENDNPAVSPVPLTARDKIEQRMSDLSDEMRENEGTGIWAIHTATRNGLQEALNILDGLEWDPEEEAWVRPFPGDPLAAILSAPPVAPSVCNHVLDVDDNVSLPFSPDECPRCKGTWIEFPYGFQKDAEIERLRKLLAAAPSVGELEWRDSHLNGYDTGTMFEANMGGDDADGNPRRWYVCVDFDEDVWYLTNDWMSDLRIGDAYETPDEAKSLANSLQRILSGAAEEGE